MVMNIWISQKALSIGNRLYCVISIVFLFIARFRKVRCTKEKMTVYLIRIILQT